MSAWAVAVPLHIVNTKSEQLGSVCRTSNTVHSSSAAVPSHFWGVVLTLKYTTYAMICSNAVGITLASRPPASTAKGPRDMPNTPVQSQPQDAVIEEDYQLAPDAEDVKDRTYIDALYRKEWVFPTVEHTTVEQTTVEQTTDKQEPTDSEDTDSSAGIYVVCEQYRSVTARHCAFV
eukprot:11329-Heterococcus_DN1.PRE.1